MEFPPVTRCFILPFQGQGEYRSYEVKSKEPFQIYISADEMEVTVSVDKEDTVSQLAWKEFDGPPHCDVMGNSMELDFENGDIFQDTYYHFTGKRFCPLWWNGRGRNRIPTAMVTW